MKQTEATDHDRLFKELLQNFFPDFMQAFFPAMYREMDFSSLKFLQQEIITDVTAGKKHIVDLLAEVKLKGEDSVIIIHVENQAQYQKDFSRRMFIYFSRIFEKTDKIIVPIVVFSYDTPKEEPQGLTLGFLSRTFLNFRYLTLELKKKHWRDFVESNNPLALAFMCKMGFKPEERVQIKLAFMNKLAGLPLNAAQKTLLTGFFETYLILNCKEEKIFYRELKKLSPEEVERVLEITTSWHKKGWQKGKREGKREGKLEGQAQILMQVMKKRFPQVPPSWEEKLRKLSEENLSALTEAVLEATSLEDLEHFFKNQK